MDKPYKLHDSGGLILLVRPSGTKVWQVPYKIYGKHNIYTIGQYSPVPRPGYYGTADARKERDEVKALVTKGIDPNKNKAKIQLKYTGENPNNFECIALEWYEKQDWVPKHAVAIMRTLENDVFPVIGQKDIADINAQDVLTVIEPIEKRGALDVAKRVCKRMEAIFDYSIAKGLREYNPAHGRSKIIAVRKVIHRPSLTEKQLPEFLEKLEAYTGRKYIQLAMKMLVLTFVRPGELRFAKWGEFDLDKALWLIPEERMKMSRNHSVPLSKQVIALLAELKKEARKSEYLFPSVKTAFQPISDVTLTKVLRDMGYVGEKKVVPHGFRHTASTILNERGFNRDHIEKQLAHSSENKIRSTYNHAEYLNERHKMMQWWADYLDKVGK